MSVIRWEKDRFGWFPTLGFTLSKQHVYDISQEEAGMLAEISNQKRYLHISIPGGRVFVDPGQEWIMAWLLILRGRSYQ